MCEMWIKGTLANLTNEFEYRDVLTAMVKSCTAPHVADYKHQFSQIGKVKRSWVEVHRPYLRKNYTDLCLEMTNTLGEFAADMIWGHWHELYLGGTLVNRVCQTVAGCVANVWLDG